ncbi:MAG: type VII toxin-antitoxin system HepT family RNase toxin [Halanaerobiales bacterium]
MVNKEILLDRLNIIKNSIERLKKLSNISEAEFKSSDDYYAIAEHHLRRSLEAVLDIGRHICVKESLGKPQDYTEIFDILYKGGVLDKEFAERIRGMAGYRNRLVHMYNQVSRDELFQIIQERMLDFEKFTKEILEYINQEM